MNQSTGRVRRLLRFALVAFVYLFVTQGFLWLIPGIWLSRALSFLFGIGFFFVCLVLGR